MYSCHSKSDTGYLRVGLPNQNAVRKKSILKPTTLLPTLVLASTAIAHQGPDPVMRLRFQPRFQHGQILVAQHGPDLVIHGEDPLRPARIGAVPALAQPAKPH